MFELTETRIRAARPKDKPYKLTDGKGLHLLVTPKGSRLWRFRYRHERREGMVGVGAYPTVSLKLARERVEAARQALENGVTPAAQRRAEREAKDSTFATIAHEWLSKRQHKLAERTINKTRWMLDTFVCPKLGSRPIAEIEAPALLAALRIIENKNAHETAHRTKQLCGRIFRYAIATGRAKRDPSADLRGALAPVEVTNRSAILEPVKVGELLRAIDGYIGYRPTQFALKLAPLLFARPGELRAAEWTEFDLDAAEWRIPAARMKMREQHIVPLAKQAVALLRELRRITGDGKYLFPGVRSRTRPISDNTLNAALRRMGYSADEVTTHGFRSTASTLLNEKGFAPDVIELQLAHAERNKVRAAYNKAQRLPERRKMMQEWADYLDTLKAAKPAL